ncbi:uncharacterized protein LOC119834896 [Zerene cesonia]|uniref:uncharacterized protein LOC119834896 n=1 Tax=Zerene cesonia TaxID=33412 RepID=UPI0018E58DD2|nr:uncharacterized protein LOC119834896 [Zerene cesonia]
MPFRTPRRRISPRTKRRVRAIKNFFKKTLGTSSQTDCKTTSSIIISVSDLKSKIDIIEQQLDKVSKHCRDLSCLENSIKRAESSTTQNISNDKRSLSAGTNSKKSLRGVETRIIYKTPKQDYIKSDESEYATKYQPNDKKKTINSRASPSKYNQDFEDRTSKQIRNNEKSDKKRAMSGIRPEKQKLYRASSSINLYSPKDKDRTDPSCSGYHRSSKHKDSHHAERAIHHEQRERIKNDRRDMHLIDDQHKSRRKKHKLADFDEEFIADIIRRQYKPVQLFGRRLSDYSQFSAPVCRDQEFSPRNDLEEGSELCSCCYEGQRRVSHRYCNKHDVSDMRSICDARLYSSKRHKRYKQAYINNYNDSTVYDLVPVKEKTSPKSRRKFIEETLIPYECYKEVPPSPRTHRPRLNLKTQHYDYEDSIAPKRRNKQVPGRSHKHNDIDEASEHSDNSFNENLHKKESLRPIKVHDTNLQCSTNCTEPNNINNDTLITHVTESTTNKTDQALFEIKDILQSFLQEIKKETTLSNTQINSEPIKSPETQTDQKNIPSQVQNTGQNFCTLNNLGQCPVSPFMPPFTNPCCYPILPICPINCSPNGYVLPTPSYTCANCANSSKETTCHNNKSSSNHKHPQPYDETQELIKEIYKFVAQSPNTPTSKRFNHANDHTANIEKKILTSRSVGSSNASKRDVMVETPQMKCYSKSCEAIGSRMTTATYYSTNPSYSDTVLEKLSLEVSDSSSEFGFDKEPTEKMKRHKFSKVLQKIGLFKRKKKDIIEEVSESESTVEVKLRHNSKPPFPQHIMDYSVHRQEYFHPPPIHDSRYCHAHDAPHRHACGDDGYGPRTSPYNAHKHRQCQHDHSTPHCYHVQPREAAPCCNHDYDAHYNNLPKAPQVPLCLKEIEVKSTGTQSDRKMSIFKKFKKKTQPPLVQRPVIMQQQHSGGTQTAKEKNVLFNWKTLQQKAKQASSNSDPMKFSLKTQKQLAEGDMKLRNAMLKKLFYKRNPFSPRNLIVRTLLGKDKSSWGEPPKMYRPRMFI